MLLRALQRWPRTITYLAALVWLAWALEHLR